MALRFTKTLLLAPVIAAAGLLASQLGAQTAPAPVAAPAAAPAPAPAKPQGNHAGPQPYIYLSADGTAIYLIGDLADGSFERFDALLYKSPNVKTAYLSSPGGYTMDGRLIAALVRKRKLNTYVELYCASACTQIFVAGRERVIGKNAMLGFHQASWVDPRSNTRRGDRSTTRELSPTSVFGVNGSDALRLAYEQAGIEKSFIRKVLRKKPEEMWVPTVEELTEAKVITRRTETMEFPLPEGSISWDEMTALLAKRPLWERAARLFPSAYKKGFSNAWRLGNSGSELESAINTGRSELIVAMMSRVAQASDSVLDRHLALYGAEARRQAANGYQTCLETDDEEEAVPKPPLEETTRFNLSEDQLLIEAMDTPPIAKPMSHKEALKIFREDITPLLPKNFRNTESCKAGFQMVMAIDRLTGKKRFKVYRAMLILPDAFDE